MKIISKTGRWLSDAGRVFAREWQLVLHDQGVMIFFILLPLMYPVVYTLIYNPEVLRKIPVVVVDNDRSEASRKLVRDASASPTIGIYDYVPSMQEAKTALAEENAYAILYIPEDFGKKIGSMEPAHASLYVEMNLLLRYRDMLSALTEVQLKDIADITADRASLIGVDGSRIKLPVNSQANMMGDTEQGFASFVMPGILVLILQQSMVLGICMLGGTSRERRRRNGGIDPRMIHGVPLTATVLGRSACYMVFYIAPTIFLLQIVPHLFNLPMQGDPVQWLLLMLPFVLACTLFGQTFNYFVTDRESSFLIVVVTSLLFLFFAGFTWPTYAIPTFWRIVGDFIPSTWGVTGFIHINSNGGTLFDNQAAYWWLWGLCVLYFFGALLSLRLVRRRAPLEARRYQTRQARIAAQQPPEPASAPETAPSTRPE